MKFLGLLTALLLPLSIPVENVFADISPLVPYTKVTEQEAKLFVTVGKDEKEIEGKFGAANQTDAGKDGSEVWTYLVNPRAARDAHSSYYGFEVFFKDRKVTYLGIVRGGA